MPVLKKNTLYPVSVLLPQLQIGMEIIANGDGFDPTSWYYYGIIEKIINNSEESPHSISNILIRRGDSVQGRGEGGTWEIRVSSKKGLKSRMAILEEQPSPNRELKFGDVVRLQNGPHYSFGMVAGIARHNYAIAPLEGLGPDYQGGDDGISMRGRSDAHMVINRERISEILFFFTLDELQCAVTNCATRATNYVNRRFYCDEHLHGFSVIQCSECGIQITGNTVYRSGSGRHYFCHICYQNSRITSSPIQDYSYKPNPIFLFTEGEKSRQKNLLYMGAEIEMEFPMQSNDELPAHYGISGRIIPTVRHSQDADQIASNLVQKYKDKAWFYLKHDGSIHHGFELVTQPATFKKHEELPWESLFTWLKDHGAMADTTSTCGLHIHADKSFLSQAAQIRLAYFIHTHKTAIEKISRRRSNGYSSFKDLDYYRSIIDSAANATTDADKEQRLQTLAMNDGRHEALNWQPRYTVEFRMFRSTIQREILLASFQFVQMAMEFSKEISTKVLESRSKAWKAFIEFLQVKEARYLLKHLETIGYSIETD